jgi:hypothetical protein
LNGIVTDRCKYLTFVYQVDIGGGKKSSGKEGGTLISWQLVFYGTETHPLSIEDTEQVIY